MRELKNGTAYALAQKKRTEGLAAEEDAERSALHREYAAAFRASLGSILDHTTVRRPDGSEEKLRERKKQTSEHKS